MANTVDLKNNLLGFSNPNYQLDDAVNCNTAAEDGLYDELYEELDSVCNFRRGPSVKNRRGYANLDLTSMGIDLTTGPATTNTTTMSNTTNVLSSPGSDNNSNRDTTLAADDNRILRDNNMGRTMTKSIDNFLNEGNAISNCPDLLPNSDELHLMQRSDSEIRGMDINSPDSNDSGIQASTTIVPVHVTGRVTDGIFGVKQSPSPPSDDKTTPISESRDDILVMPPGWERHEDADGPYYWHIKSGTIQRDPPPPPPPDFKELKRSSSPQGDLTSSFSVSTTTSSSFAPSHDLASPKTETTESQLPNEKDKPIRFAVRSLGWVEIAEDDLTPERSSKAVNKCIVDLSLGRNDILDAVGRWGDGKDLYMDLDDDSLKLVDPENLTLLNTQPIHTIRVWGVGRDNGRDFAYVARDRASRKHMCHVFRCDTPARTIANTLRDICKRIMLERSMSSRPLQGAGIGQRGGGNNNNNCTSGNSSGLSSNGGVCGGPIAAATANNNIINNNGGVGRSGLPRPTNLPTEHRRFHHRMPHSSYTAQSFPTPMEEPKKILKVRYAGVVQVARPTGMETLNQAMDEMAAKNPFDQWQYVHVAVAPSTITILEQGEEGKLIAECRVRYLSFLGIGKNVKHCAFIMRTAEEEFMAHVFYCEPSSGALCKTIEAACKLRYQKCLDAHRQQLEMRNTDLQNSKGIGAALKNMLGSLAGRKARSADS